MKRAGYHPNSEGHNPVKTVEIRVSQSGIADQDFSLISAYELPTDEWTIFEIVDSVAARYIKLIVINSEQTDVDTCDFAEIQVCAAPIAASGVKSSHLAPSLKPDKFTISANYPNPFNPGTCFRISVAEPAYINLSIYNIQGQLIRVVTQEEFKPGIYNLFWNGGNHENKQVSSGAYIVVLHAITEKNQTFSDSRKLLFLK
jgi:hypothetical protein